MEEGKRENGPGRGDEDFDSYEDLEEYFIHCVETINHHLGTKYTKKEIGYRLGFTSPSALSLRLNLVDMGNLPRFNLKHLWLWINVFKDNRPIRFLDHAQKKMARHQNNGVAERLEKIGVELNRILTVMKESEDS